MQVTIDPESGFCFGVVQAIQNAEEELKQSKSLLCLGDIVHNGKEINRLSSKGLQTINRQQLKEVQNSTVLIRAHGEPPETYQLANSNNIKIIDSTCPIVLKLQKRIKTSWEEMKTCNGQIAIFGKPKHAEVIGLNGHANNQAIIITSEDDLDQIDSRRAVRFFSQTTMNSTKYSELVELTREACKKVGNSNFKYDKSICTSVSRRSKNLQKFAETYDIVIFVSSKKSSNGNYLYTICKEKNPNTYFIAGPEDINPEWFNINNNVGVSGATSTPHWIMEDVKAKILSL